MIISASFSKPTKLCEEKFSKKYLRAKAKLNSSQSSKEYSIEFFTENRLSTLIFLQKNSILL